MSRETKRFIICAVRWVARVLVLLVSAPFLYFLLFRSGEVVPRLSWRVPNELPLFLAWVVVVVGFVISWRWEIVGGLVIAVAAVAIAILGVVGCGIDELPTCTLVAAPYLLTALLLLGCCWGRRRLECPGSNGEASA
jgi:hypothetical protein